MFYKQNISSEKSNLKGKLQALGLCGLLSGSVVAYWLMKADDSANTQKAPIRETPPKVVAQTSALTRTEGRNPDQEMVKIQRIVNLENPLTSVERCHSLQALLPGLEKEEVEVLFSFLANPAPLNHDTWYPAKVFELKNNLLNELLRNGDPKNLGYRDYLVDLSKNHHADPVMRDYALQHLAILLTKFEPETSEFDHHLVFAAGDNGELAATSLLHLRSAHREGNLSENQTFMMLQAAKKISLDPEIQVGPRATALQVLSSLQAPDMLDEIREIAMDQNEHAFLRVSALASLGNYPASAENPEIIKFLKNTATDPDSRLSRAAISSLHRITSGKTPVTL